MTAIQHYYIKLMVFHFLKWPFAVGYMLFEMDKMLKEEFQIQIQLSIFWTDSPTVLRYIDNRTARFKMCVANRIIVIQEATKPLQWRYCRMSQRPAD